MHFNRILPPVWFLLSIILMVGLDFWLPVKQLWIEPVNYLGSGLILMGIVMVLSVAYLFRQKGTTIKPFESSTYLVQSGLFRLSRNPIYLGMIAVLIGVWMWLGSLLPVVVIPAFTWVIQENFIKAEEKMLEDKFGEEYRTYQAQVRRWI
jgi:protein-S-isoprenylcysteine O-methyltransferase Ste14